uniref:Large ribosomal subunit protein eL28 n=1 Tax=Culicoides sonorensis TaxID=179676 RepID=A0A336MBE7_CULSO
MSSSHLNWLIVRDNNAFLFKQRNIKKPFSKERNNLTNLSSFRYSGLVHKRTVGIVPAADKKGFTLEYKKGKCYNKPQKAAVSVTFKSGPRRALRNLKRVLKNNKYRRDLTQVALRRASAIIRSQKPVKGKKEKKAAKPKAE